MAVLVVDDSAETCRVLRDLLRSGGHHDVITAGSAEEAFSHLGIGSSSDRTDRFDLVLMDLGMPGMGGVEACRVIKSHQASQDIPVLLVTGQPESHHVQAAFAAGAQDFIRKPVERSVLLARVHVAQQYKREIDRRKQRERELLRTKQLLEQANAALNRLAALDGLTGVANRRRFDEYLDIEWRRAMRTGRSIALILADIDRFKPFNDIHGHPAGDECLRKVTAALGRAVHRSSDLLARYGGEEFAVVLPGTDAAGAAFLAESMRAAVGDLHICHPGSEPTGEVSISLGVASLTPERQSLPAALIRLADGALYCAKGEGRNRSCIAAIHTAPHTVTFGSDRSETGGHPAEPVREPAVREASDTGQPAARHPDTGQPAVGQPDTGRSDTGRSDTGRSDTDQLDTEQLNTGQLDTGQPGTEQLKMQPLDTDQADTDQHEPSQKESDPRDSGGPGRSGSAGDSRPTRKLRPDPRHTVRTVERVYDR